MKEQKVIQIFDEAFKGASDWSKFYDLVLRDALSEHGMTCWEITPEKKPMNKKFFAILLISFPILCLFGFLLSWAMELLP